MVCPETPKNLRHRGAGTTLPGLAALIQTNKGLKEPHEVPASYSASWWGMAGHGEVLHGRAGRTVEAQVGFCLPRSPSPPPPA